MCGKASDLSMTGCNSRPLSVPVDGLIVSKLVGR